MLLYVISLKMFNLCLSLYQFLEYYFIYVWRKSIFIVSREIQNIDYISLISTDRISNVVISSVFVTIPDGRALVRSCVCL